MKLTKLWPLATASLCSMTAALAANENASRGSCRPEEISRGSCKRPFVQATNPEMLCVVNPHAKPYADCARTFVTIEGLLWNAHQDGLEFAIQNSESAGLATSQVSSLNSSAFYDADVIYPKSKRDFGFRVGLGYDLTHDGWDLYADWTHFRTTATKHVESDIQIVPFRLYTLFSGIVPGAENALGVPDLLAAPVTLNPTVDSIHARWKLHFDLIDLELGREFYTSKYLTLRPHLGLRGASIRQKYDIDYSGGAFTQGGVVLQDDVDFKNNFWGVGVRGGLNSLWHWGRTCGGDWSFYGNLALSLIYGHFDIEQNETVENVSDVAGITGGDLNVASTENSYRATRAMTDLALGLRYDYDCTDSSYHIALWLGWEHHIAFGMNQWARYSSIVGTGRSTPTSPSTYTNYVPQDGDLTTQGWTLGFEVDF